MLVAWKLNQNLLYVAASKSLHLMSELTDTASRPADRPKIVNPRHSATSGVNEPTGPDP